MMGGVPEPTGIGVGRDLLQRGGTEPAPYQGAGAGWFTAGCAWGVASASQIPKRNLGRQSSRRPLRGEGEVSATTRASAADGRDGWESRQRSSPRCPATPDNPSVSLRLTAPFTQGSLALRGTGDTNCHSHRRRVGPAGLLAMTMVFCHSEERSDVGIRPFRDGRWTWVRAAGSSAHTESPINHPSQPVRSKASVPAAARDGRESAQRPSQKGDCPATTQAALSEAESAERVAGQIRSLPDDRFVQHGVPGSVVC